MKTIVYLCFIFPLVFNTLNLQAFVLFFTSESMAQASAYANLALILVGAALTIKKQGTFSRTNKLWIFFFAMYYAIGFIASLSTHFDAPIARTIVPVVYFIGFFMFLRNEEQKKLFFKALTISLVISCLMTILLYNINFDIDYNGFHIYKIDRAGGVYGDANNAALVCILAYLFFNKFYTSDTFWRRIFKTFVILVIFYSLFLTFSTTGLSTFIIVLVISNYKYFKGTKILLFLVSLILLIIAVINLPHITSGMDLSKAQREKIQNLSNVLTLNTEKVDNSGRGDLLQNMMNHVYENPIIGNGIDFAVSIRGHNTYMGVWADAGIFTFVFFIFLLLTYIARSFKLSVGLRYFCLSVLLTLCIFMVSLQTVINQGYIMAIFAYLGYLIDFPEEKHNATMITDI